MAQIVQPWRQAKTSFLVSALPPMLWLLFFFILPLAIVWLYSFGENRGMAAIDITGTWSNYARALQPLYLAIFVKSLIIAGITTVFCLLLGFPVALAISFASDKAKPWLLLLVMLPFWTNLLIRTYALIAVLRSEGYINMGFEWALTRVGMIEPGSFEPYKLLYNNGAVVVGLVYVHLPFMALPLYAALDKMDRSLIEASLDLGAGHIQTFAKIIVPLALPGLLTGIIITFVPALGAYLTPDLLGGPDGQMIASVIERQFKRANDWPFGAALSFLLMYATFIAIALQSMLSRGKETGSVP